ncbi:oxygen-independent coproporphyrinogen III oxidase [Alteromonas aestuariivivens]|uniref:Coproporphyrinogen-III oxidase n=1 Tax=Alteromonas aestuariivivens TaxID=1938339 RepID=A0A3D8M4I0_9ALTE|nr:oxygen-independent coproporphyrinogen III oxidase [Alteromonas aestuariivivens]RDV24480.1 oxygen-independent coproporphyrinogen III oxidase [Alteromonas aestuariivivens]
MAACEIFSPSLLNKYNRNGPRYTSYPTALEFRSKLPQSLLTNAAADSSAKGLSLYIHIPFCHNLCYYCGCNKIVTRHQDKADRYLDYLEQEIALRSTAFRHMPVRQLHLGGGTPSFLTLAQQARLMTLLKQHFDLRPDLECSIELDPRGVTTEYLDGLYQLGYNRISIGVQDITPKVQAAINRIQSTSHIEELVAHAHHIGFSSVNLDLIYGLPHQTLQTFRATLSAVQSMAPQRISLFSYAHLPQRFAAQRKIKDEWLPQAGLKSQLMEMAMQVLQQAGYQQIGMDHFALPEDELAKAQRHGDLHRNFQGYTTQGELDLLGLGVSSISAVANVYAQNPKTLNGYYAALDGDGGLVDKGCVLSRDDEIRRYVIQQLMCNLTLDFSAVKRQFAIDVEEYFADELQRLKPFVNDGLMTVDNCGLRVYEAARVLIRAICMQFDAYLLPTVNHNRYSRVI